MHTIIAGSRSLSSPVAKAYVFRYLETTPPHPITRVLSGTARGPDSFGAQWAKTMGIPVDYYPANWERFGRMAGFMRNVDMAKHAKALIVFWDGKSRGTGHMLTVANNRSLKVTVVYPPKEIINNES